MIKDLLKQQILLHFGDHLQFATHFLYLVCMTLFESILLKTYLRNIRYEAKKTGLTPVILFSSKHHPNLFYHSS
jgi:hypothetical protein